MKKLLGIGFCAMATVMVYANQTQETFLKACAQYDQGHVKEALSLYESLEHQTPSLLYNKGLCQYMLGEYAKALSSFRKVERQGNTRIAKKAHEAIIIIQKKLQVPHDSHWYTTALLAESYVALYLVQFLFLLLLITILVLFWFKLFTGLKVFFLSILLVMSGAFCAFDYWFSHQIYAVVVHEQAAVYTGPDREFHKIGQLRLGQEVKVVEESQSWYKVSFQELIGWVEQTDLDLII